MESAIQLAEMMARGKLVPTHLHNSPGDCLMVIEASMRWQMSPFAVAQCTSVIQGKLMFEGKLVAAALNASGILSSRLDYDFSGEGAQRAVTVRGTLRGETKAREVTVFLADAKTTNSMWTKQPDQQLVYAGTRVWARRHAPEVMLGVYAPEEFDRAEPFNGPTLEATPEREAINNEVPLQAAAAATPRGDRKVDPTVYEAPRPKMAEEKPLPDYTDAQWDAWISKLRAACAVVSRQQELVEMADPKRMVGKALAEGPDWVKRDIDKILADNYARFPAEDEPADERWDTPRKATDELPEVEIAGAEKMASG
jgi:hypothetical protein